VDTDSTNLAIRQGKNISKDSVLNPNENQSGTYTISNKVDNPKSTSKISQPKKPVPKRSRSLTSTTNNNKDNDNDGYKEEVDCDDNDDSITIPGNFCDDQNAETENDRINENCVCIGTKRALGDLWYSDIDKDGYGNPVDSIYSTTQPIHGTWVKDNSDYCPNRHGTDNGCPEVILNQINITDKKSSDYKINLEITPSDKIYWYSKNDMVAIVNENSTYPSLKPKGFGMFSFTAKVSFNEYLTEKDASLCSYMSKTYLQKLFNEDIIRIGQYNKGDPVPQLERNKSENSRKEIIAHSSINIQISENNKIFGNDIGAFIDAKLLTKGSFVKSIKLNDLQFDFNTCQISKIDLSLEK